MLLERHGGDKDAVIEDLIRPPCDISQFAQIGLAYGPCLDMTSYEFVIAARRIRKGKPGLEGKVPKRSTKQSGL